MPRIFKLSLKILLLIVVLFVVALLRMDLNQFKSAIDSHILQIADSNKLRFRFARSDYSLRNVTFDTANISGKSWPIAFEFEKISFEPHWLSFAFLRPSLEVDANAYGGTLNGKIDCAGKGGYCSLVADAVNLKLESFLPIFSMGISGTAGAKANISKLTTNSLNEGTLEIHIKKGEKPNRTKLSLAQWGLPFSVDIPPFHNLELVASVLSQGLETKVETLSLSSSLLRLNLKGTFAPKSRMLLQGDIMLSQDGIAELGQSLQLIAGDRQLVADKIFRLEVRQPLGYPQVTLKE